MMDLSAVTTASALLLFSVFSTTTLANPTTSTFKTSIAPSITSSVHSVRMALYSSDAANHVTDAANRGTDWANWSDNLRPTHTAKPSTHK